MIFVFLIFAAILVWFSFKSLRGGVTYLRFFKTELAKSPIGWAPHVTVLCPCRGVDEGMEKNLTAIFEQDYPWSDKYPGYEVIFIVDDDADPAKAVIEQLLETYGIDPAIGTGNARFVAWILTAPKAEKSSQKVENLLEGELYADDASDCLVFVDSDTCPSPNWLRYLVAPLEDKSVGAATGYRWFISKKPTFASAMCSVWNASIASSLGPNTRSNFCWGGSTAMRRDVFDTLDIAGKWRGALSDDFVVTRAVHDAGLDIVHVPQALTATIEDSTFGKLLEFTTRQMKITRVYMPRLWMMSFFGSALFCGVMLSAFLIVILSRENTIAVWAAITTLALVSAFSIGKSWLRLKAVRLALPQYDRELKRQIFTQNTLWLLSPALFLYNSIAALLSRRMVWRGTTYELKSPTETVIIRSE